MKLEEAIEIKERELVARSHYPDSKLRQADKLGIEALKREIQHRQMAKSEYIWLLPGETKD